MVIEIKVDQEALAETGRRIAEVMSRLKVIAPERLHHDDQTLDKVTRVLRAHGLDGQDAIDLISDLQNEGILFRENARDATPEQLEERAARLLSAANALRGIDTPPDAMEWKRARSVERPVCAWRSEAVDRRNGRVQPGDPAPCGKPIEWDGSWKHSDGSNLHPVRFGGVA